jgi:hypothetical protein
MVKTGRSRGQIASKPKTAFLKEGFWRPKDNAGIATSGGFGV